MDNERTGKVKLGNLINDEGYRKAWKSLTG
jgi:hypothetical protein